GLGRSLRAEQGRQEALPLCRRAQPARGRHRRAVLPDHEARGPPEGFGGDPRRRQASVRAGGLDRRRGREGPPPHGRGQEGPRPPGRGLPARLQGNPARGNPRGRLNRNRGPVLSTDGAPSQGRNIMNMKPWIISVSLVAALVGTTGCATKKYVK